MAPDLVHSVSAQGTYTVKYKFQITQQIQQEENVTLHIQSETSRSKQLQDNISKCKPWCGCDTINNVQLTIAYLPQEYYDRTN